MRSFASQGQASSVNRFRSDDVALLCCVLPCTGNQTERIKLGVKLRLFITELLCPSVVHVAVRNHKDTVIMILMGKNYFLYNLNILCVANINLYVGHLMLAVVCWPSLTSAWHV